jgi:pimeloyl-ACP methyl ester carboxylesterase
MRGLAASLGILPKVLVGIGMGASLAFAYLAQAERAELPARVVVHTPAYYPGAIRPTARWAVKLLTSPAIFPLVAGILGYPAVREQFVRRLTAAPDGADHAVRSLIEDVDRASLRVFRGLARDMVRVDFRPILRTLDLPTLALVAEHDPFVYATEVSRLGRWMGNAQVVVQRDVAHGWTARAIEEQNQLLAEFLSPSSS